MHDSHHVPESASEAVHHLRCQRYLRHKHYGLSAFFQHIADELQINLGLSAPRNSMQQHLIEFPGIDEISDAFQRRLLLTGRLHGLCRFDLPVLQWISFHFDIYISYVPILAKCIQHRRRYAGKPGKVRRCYIFIFQQHLKDSYLLYPFYNTCLYIRRHFLWSHGQACSPDSLCPDSH